MSFFALVAGVVIATILTVLAGLAIASSGAVAHDLYTNVFKRGNVSPRGQLVVGRVSAFAIAAIAAALALGGEKLNVAFLAKVAFAIAASTTMPVLLTIYWRGFNRTGAVSAMVGGLTVALVLVAQGPDMLGDSHVFPLSIPAIVSIPAGFLCAYVGSLAGRRAGHRRDPGDMTPSTRLAFSSSGDHGDSSGGVVVCTTPLVSRKQENGRRSAVVTTAKAPCASA
jgi:cation/acetate symporter